MISQRIRGFRSLMGTTPLAMEKLMLLTSDLQRLLSYASLGSYSQLLVVH